MEIFLAPQNWLFTLALVLAVCLCLLQLVAGIGDLGLDNHVSVGADGGHDVDVGAISGLTDWLHLGKLPMAVIFMLGGICFGLSGLAMQSFVHGSSGSFLPVFLAVPLALIASLPLVRVSGLVLRRILPQDETEAVSSSSFVGSQAQITAGTARRGYPAEARLHDAFGKAHYVQVEPEEDDEILAAGTHVLLLTRHGHVFRAIDNSSAIEVLEET